MDDTILAIDASTFQDSTLRLIETLAHKVHREGPKLGLKPVPPFYFFADVFVTLRQCRDIAALLCWINADEGQSAGFDRTKGYALQALQLVRGLIDRLYNVCALLENPAVEACRFRADGYVKALKALEEDKRRYGHLIKSDWPAYLKKSERELRLSIERDSIDLTPEKRPEAWPTLGRFLKSPSGKGDRGKFLKNFAKGFWQEYSALSHGTFQGLLAWGYFSMPDAAPHEKRPDIRHGAERIISVHLGRAFGVIASLLTEVQAYFHFRDESEIDHRLHEVWKALVVIPEVREMYDGRYQKLMEQKQIFPRLDLSKLRKENLNNAT